MNYKFIKLRDNDNKFDHSDVIIRVTTESLPTLIEEFELFLKAVGFNFDGHIEIVVEEDDVISGAV